MFCDIYFIKFRKRITAQWLPKLGHVRKSRRKTKKQVSYTNATPQADKIIGNCIKIGKWDTVMCRSTVGQRRRVIGESFNQQVNALIRAASHANVCSGALIGSVGCVSNHCKLDLVDTKENLHAQQYVDEIFVPS